MAFDCLRSQFLTRQNCPMCSHYVGQTSRDKLARLGVVLPLGWVSPPGGLHIFPTQQAAIICRPPELDSGDEAVPAMEIRMPIGRTCWLACRRTRTARSKNCCHTVGSPPKLNCDLSP